MSRNTLAYIVTLDKIMPIPDKDKIAIAKFKENDYEVIVSKDDFKIGDSAIYVEYDTVLPEYPEFEFLRKRCYREKYKGYLISAMKMAGVVSYGIVFPLKELSRYLPQNLTSDLTDALKVQSKDVLDEALQSSVTKQVKPKGFFKTLKYKISNKFPRIAAFLFKQKKEYPYPCPKTDETRIENLSAVYESWQGAMVDGTLKMDGTSVGIYYENGQLSIMSRNNVIFRGDLKKLMNIESKNLPFDEWSKKVDKLTNSANFQISSKILQICHRDKWISQIYKITLSMGRLNNIIMQGELCGPGIQKNPMGLKELDFFVFNFSIGRSVKNEPVYLIWKSIEDWFYMYGLNFKIVPRIYNDKFTWKNKAEIKEFANKLKYENDALAEGVVFRKIDPLGVYAQAERGMSNMASLKVISDNYVLKNKE